MKVREDIRKLSTTQTNLAKALGLTQPRINQLIEEGVIIRDEQDASGGVMIYRSLQNYFTAKATADGTDEADFWKEKALHEKAKRELAELKLSERRGELYEASTVESVLIELLTDFRTQLLGLGHKLSPRLEGRTAAQISAIIDSDIESILRELNKGVKSAAFNDDVKTNAEDAAAHDGQSNRQVGSATKRGRAYGSSGSSQYPHHPTDAFRRRRFF